MYGNSEEEARGHSSQDRPGRQVPMRFRVPRQGTHRGLGRSARGEQVDPGGSEAAVRSCQTKGRVGRPAPGRNAKREAGLARRGRRPRPRALTFEDPAELLQGHDPKRPGASRGAEAAMRRRQLRRRKRGAHDSARLQPRSVPIARHQVAPRGARLRSCGPPCPNPPAGSRADPAPDGRRLLLHGAPSHIDRLGAQECGRQGRHRDRPLRLRPAARARVKCAALGARAHLSCERERRVPAALPARMCPPPAPPACPSHPSRPIAGRARPRPRTLGGRCARGPPLELGAGPGRSGAPAPRPRSEGGPGGRAGPVPTPSAGRGADGVRDPPRLREDGAPPLTGLGSLVPPAQLRLPTERGPDPSTS